MVSANIFKANNRLMNFIIGIVYAIFYDYIFKTFFQGDFESEGSRYISMNLYIYIQYVVVSAFPLCFYSGLKSLASGFSFFVYVLAYVPILSSLYTWGYPEEIKISYIFVFLFFMCLFFLTDKSCFFVTWIKNKKKKFSFKNLERITILIYLLVLIANISQLRFVNFFVDSQALFENRAENNTRLIYLLCYLRGAFFPLLLVYYLKNENYIKYAICFFAYITIFMIDMQKMTFLYPFLITGLFFIMNKDSFIQYFHIAIISLLILISIFLLQFLDSPLSKVIATLFILRTLCIEGIELHLYLEFFEINNHPYTFYSHVNFVNALTHSYPYKDAIGNVVCNTDSMANATFWLMDGVAAAGIVGVVIISVIFIIFKSVVNSLSKEYMPQLCVVVFLFGIQSFLNMSLFTSLNSSGILVLYLLFVFYDLSKLKSPPKTSAYFLKR